MPNISAEPDTTHERGFLNPTGYFKIVVQQDRRVELSIWKLCKPAEGMGVVFDFHLADLRLLSNSRELASGRLIKTTSVQFRQCEDGDLAILGF